MLMRMTRGDWEIFLEVFDVRSATAHSTKRCLTLAPTLSAVQ